VASRVDLRRCSQNVWIGTTVEDQARAEERIPRLLAIPAKVRFLSCEPLLERVELMRWFYLQKNSRQDRIPGTKEFGPWYETGYTKEPPNDLCNPAVGIHWVICGGESGPNARPMHPEWARSLRDQCKAAGVAFFFKQWGEHITMDQMVRSRLQFAVSDNAYANAKPFHNTQVLKAGKHVTGRLLDGVEHSAFPNAAGTAAPLSDGTLGDRSLPGGEIIPQTSSIKPCF
jgi:hypothetical protein